MNSKQGEAMATKDQLYTADLIKAEFDQLGTMARELYLSDIANGTRHSEQKVKKLIKEQITSFTVSVETEPPIKQSTK